jgi:hypothetical protein
MSIVGHATKQQMNGRCSNMGIEENKLGIGWEWEGFGSVAKVRKKVSTWRFHMKNSSTIS